MRRFCFFSVILLLLSGGCSHMRSEKEKSLGLELPPEALSVVQQEEGKEARLRNPLYLPARRIEEQELGSPSLRALVSRMRATMAEKAGIGIAASQVGKRLQIFLIEAKGDNPRYKVLGAVPYAVFLNPKITAASQERRNFWHGCLSANGKPRGNVATYEWIEYEARDEEGKLRKGRLNGLAAVIFQHEFRHLLGGTYLDRAHFFLAKEELDRKVDAKEVPFFEPAREELPHLIGDYRVGETLEDYYARREAGGVKI